MGAGAPQTADFAIYGPIARDDFPGLCNRVCALLAGSRDEMVRCDVRGIEPDAVTVDALCRLQLAARRRRRKVLLLNASDELLELIGFMGLTEILPEERSESTRADRPVDPAALP